MERRYLSIKELADYMGLAVQTIYNLKCSAPDRLPPHVSIASGKRDLWRFDVAEVDAWMARNSLR